MLTQVQLNEFKEEVAQLIANLNEDSLRQKSRALTDQLAEPAVWNDSQKAITLTQQKAALDQKIEEIERLRTDIENLQAAHDLAAEGEFIQVFSEAKRFFNDLENQMFMNGRFDHHGAIVALHAGAGGVDAMDFAVMLAHMYQAFCTSHSFNFEFLHLSSGEEAGLKSASFRVKGENAYGHFKEEAGVHRLVRLSPFNSAHTRETSFALVEVIPTGLHAGLEVKEIAEQDLKWDYFMASGKGGQSVNTTYSAVRVTHLPTGLTVSCQNERSQHQNKLQALDYLRDKLAVLELQKQKELETELRGVHVSPEWGSQIRNYVLHPYKKIKDLRSGWETNDPDSLLEQGELLEVMWSVKRARAKK